MASVPHFQTALETVEKLPLDDQAALIEIIRQRLVAQGRSELLRDVKESREAYHKGDVNRGSVADLMKELDV
jgi:hypothetical protein